MWEDKIVEETRKVREDYAAKFQYNLEAIYLDLKTQERDSDRKIVSLSPKPPVDINRKAS
jgi:hypothetical protein